MGLLLVGKPLSWSETQKRREYVYEKGVGHFMSLYTDKRSDTAFRCGDEVEYLLVDFDDNNNKVRLSNRATEILEAIETCDDAVGDWHPEYANFMLECTPAKPYDPDFSSVIYEIENSLEDRKIFIKRFLRPTESLLTISCFPTMGVEDFLSPVGWKCEGPISGSILVPDDLIPKHPRFEGLTRNIRERRKRKVDIQVPVFQDARTQKPFVDPTFESSKEGYITMDAMVFGMGCCCVQETIQLTCLEDARRVYDQLAVFAPLALAMTASSPVFRGILSDIDCRWDVVAASVDDRTIEEADVDSASYIPKSRFSSISHYVHADGLEYSCNDLLINKDVYTKLRDSGMDESLSKHIAHLFIRDPLVVFEEEVSMEAHFETIQSTNWNSVRLKPPTGDIGWRVEFRSMENQMTSFESAAFLVFVNALTRFIVENRSFSMYISVVELDMNMSRAQKRDAVLKEKFYFNTGYAGLELTVNEIMNGYGEFKGLVGLVKEHVHRMGGCGSDSLVHVDRYFDFISNRACGISPTCASWMRKTVCNHPKYERDSVVSTEIAYDLLKEIDRISKTNMPVMQEHGC